MLRIQSLLALGLIAGLCLAACSAWQPDDRAGTPSPPFQFSEETRVALAEEPAVMSELEDTLTVYFGSRYEPHFLVQREWQRIGFDPNESPFRNAPFGADLEGRRPEVLRADNRRAFATELSLIAEGRTSEVGPFLRRPYLDGRWNQFMKSSRSLGELELRTAATHFFVDYYPGLREGAWLFVQSCAACHGSNGAGDGPMSSRLTPKPRNYRAGLFKFAAVEAHSKPRREDLLRTLVHGLPGSAMPSFRDRPLAELNALVDQIRLLSLRGEVESRLVFEWTDAEARPTEMIDEIYSSVWANWIAAAEREIEIEPPNLDSNPARWERGRQIFLDASGANCVSCHGTEGRGDGVSAVTTDSSGARTALLTDEWGQSITPRDLTSGVFRGGDRRQDVYLRIHCGIPGTPMPAIGATGEAENPGSLSEEDKWCLVDYVLALSGRGPLANSGK